jgi:MFS family permease
MAASGEPTRSGVVAARDFGDIDRLRDNPAAAPLCAGAGGDEAIFGVILSSAIVTAVLCIGLLIRYPEAMRPHAVVALAIAVYALGATGAAFVGENWMPLIATGALLGTTWAVIYTATPMVMSEMVSDERRATYFGYITGTQQVGIGWGRCSPASW